MLETSNISNSEQSENPEALIDVLNFYSESMTKSPNKFIATQETINKDILDHDSKFVRLGKPFVKTDNESSDGSFKSSSEDLPKETISNNEQPSPQKDAQQHQQPTLHPTLHQTSDHQNNVHPTYIDSKEREKAGDSSSIQKNSTKKEISDKEKKDLRDITASLDRVMGEAESLLLSFDVKKVYHFVSLFYCNFDSWNNNS